MASTTNSTVTGSKQVAATVGSNAWFYARQSVTNKALSEVSRSIKFMFCSNMPLGRTLSVQLQRDQCVNSFLPRCLHTIHVLRKAYPDAEIFMSECIPTRSELVEKEVWFCAVTR